MKGTEGKKKGELYFYTSHSHDEILMSAIEESGLFKISKNDYGEVILETCHLSVAEFSAAAYLVYRCTKSHGSNVRQSKMSEERKGAVFNYLMELCVKTESNHFII